MDHPHLYRNTPRELLEWPSRQKRLEADLLRCPADIFCLQEVHHEHFQSFYEPLLSGKGYGSLFKCRTGYKDDGCAIFFNKTKFKCLACKELELNLGTGVMDRDNIALMAIFEPLFSSKQESTLMRPIAVCTTHILFNMRRGDVKLAQLSYILANLNAFILDFNQDHGIDEDETPPVIFTGDFNLEPFSPLHSFLLEGSLVYVGEDSTMLAGSSEVRDMRQRIINDDLLENIGLTRDCRLNKEENTNENQNDKRKRKRLESESKEKLSPQLSSSFCDTRPSDEKEFQQQSQKVSSDKDSVPGYPSFGSLRHPFNFISAYKHYIRNEQGRELKEISTYHENTSSNVDYILFDVREGCYMRFSHTRGLPTIDMLKSIGKLPNETNGSDHFPLYAYFCLES